MESRQPVFEGTVTGTVSLEHKISGAALKCQSRRDYKGHVVECALLLHGLVHSKSDGALQNAQQRAVTLCKFTSGGTFFYISCASYSMD